MTRAIVFANGDCSDYVRSLVQISSTDFLVCADGGIRHCRAAGLQPDLLVGDFDSIDHDAAQLVARGQIECLNFPPEKNASDLELTFDTLCDRSIDEVVLLGVSGGRTDHFLFNWQLAGSRAWPFNLRVVDDFVDAYLVSKARPLSLAPPLQQIFSVIPLVSNATGVGVSGAKYPLDNACLPLGSTLGLSNVVTGSRLQVSVEQGIVMVMLAHEDKP